MQVNYIVYEQVSTPASREAGDYESQGEFTSGTSSVKEIVKDVARNLGIRYRDSPVSDSWFCSETPEHDRDYYTKGIERYYALHFPALSFRAQQRVNQMLQLVWGRTPDAL